MFECGVQCHILMHRSANLRDSILKSYRTTGANLLMTHLDLYIVEHLCMSSLCAANKSWLNGSQRCQDNVKST